MKTEKTNAQVHRYGDKIAVWTGKGGTEYFTPKEALLLAKTIRAAAKDCEAQKVFSNSTLATFHLYEE
jgi:hypothetical protein